MVGKLVLIDGEHYPDVTAWAVERLGDVCCAVFLGGGEKIGDIGEVERRLQIPVYRGDDYISALEKAIVENGVTEVIDLSDEPVVDYEMRFRVASLCLRLGVAYRGADFLFTPREMKRPPKPSIAVIGTGKRVGKTAVGGFVARTLKEISRPLIITMGRGGPERPEVVDGESFELTPEFLAGLARQGRHAASDHFEDALTSRVTTIGCRRCGGGMAGFSFFDVVDEAVEMAKTMPHDLLIFEGSGASFPAYRAGAYITVTSALQREEYLRGYFGPFRLSLADLVVVTMAEVAGRERAERVAKIVREVNPGADVHLVTFRPRPLGDVSGKRVALVMTNELGIEPARRHLESLGAEVLHVSPNLSRRNLLRGDLASFRGVDAVVVELKAAAVDVVTLWALENGLEVIYFDNEPVNVDGKSLREAVLALGRSVLGGGR
ncbi:putative cyclic 2,3-diphosphoglycerate synthetase [Thermococcus cleftensis]|uniref:Cyclic 2,3-diphosphoglycerate synthetase n=1 Tax=Thermococcus cleftensis (strain DSM 27260 / KACC 17922 / CL1) TaxID=163003 RepID=I3ZWQ1_THECF|nr:2,3-phosphoglycerate synthetase [Thermococcus cleftensis]AFL96135.1 putative cyclic 2,3-diphosphoglycerate synthetase [Thermococcus cleftensis]